jgi:hypothetical protein
MKLKSPEKSGDFLFNHYVVTFWSTNGSPAFDISEFTCNLSSRICNS